MTMEIKFGTDGWRGVIADDFTFDNVRICAQAVAVYLQHQQGSAKGLVVGYDTRFESERFAQATAEVLVANSIPVHLCQEVTPTPVVSFSIKQLNAAGAVIITASHNPGRYNGFKFRPEYAGAASEEVLGQIQAIIDQIRVGEIAVQRVQLSTAVEGGLLKTFDPWPDYVRNVVSLVDLERIRESHLRVVVDPMYGAGSGYLPRLLHDSNVRLRELHGERNPSFPGIRAPEPVAENMEELRRTVQSDRADVGLATDGDADRLGLIDEQGWVVDNFLVYPLLLHYLLARGNVTGPIIKTVATSSLVDRVAEHFGVPVHMTGVGFKHIAPAMIRFGAIMGGEDSGGYAFGDHIPERDGILAGLRVLDMLAQSGKPLSELLVELQAKFGTHYYQRRDWPFDSALQKQVRDALDSVRPREMAGLPVVNAFTFDGLRLELADGSWLLLRLSGTEPLVRVYAESRSENRVQFLIDRGRRLLGLAS